ncbi:MAG: GGDEF domain-containing protein [Ruminococcaceae bacterium]|nr:GGDEF domain-containing protein [Oscillospiraceae bacterium]
MNPLLIVRSEILSTLIILFLLLYNQYCSRFRKSKDYFFGMAAACLGHNIAALVTELTVNSATVPRLVNDGGHMFFFFFALVFALKYYEYVLSLILPRKESKKYRVCAHALCGVVFAVMLFSPIQYLRGNGTNYSAGFGPTFCYLIGFLFIIIADVMLIVYRKRINFSIVGSLLPISMMALSFLLIQKLVPEFLFSGPAMTLIAVGLFFAMENPVGKIQQRAFIDHDTQVWNRNCYEYDLENKIARSLSGGARLTYVLGDVNGLKAVNDTLGHISGDELIAHSASVLQESLEHAFRIYRIGGDEFAALYLDTALSVVEAEVSRAKKLCGEYRIGSSIPTGMSFGIAESAAQESLAETVRRADVEMYAAKERYYQENGIERRKH